MAVEQVVSTLAIEDIDPGIPRQHVAMGRPAEIRDSGIGIARRIAARRGTGREIDRHRGGRMPVGRRVAAGAAVEPVGPGTAFEDVVPGVAEQGVGAGAAIERVEAVPAGEHVVARSTLQPVVAAAAGQGVVMGRSEHPLDPGQDVAERVARAARSGREIDADPGRAGVV